MAIVTAALALAAAPAVLAQRAAPTTSASVVALVELRDPIISTINAARRAHGLRPVRLVPSLERAARAHARSMGRAGYFSHASANGTPAMERLRRLYGGSYLGETLLWRSPGVTAEQAVQMWLGSPPHRQILLSPSYSEIGLSAVYVEDAPGVYGGHDVAIVVADFGAR